MKSTKDGQILLVRYKDIVGPKLAAHVMPSVRIELAARSGTNQLQGAKSRRSSTTH